MSETANQSWSIVVLCYNEEGNIKRVVQDVQAKLTILSSDAGEIIIINDGSSDNSDSIIRELLNEDTNSNIKYICHPTNLGIGAALHSGYATASCENVIIVPGDGQFDLGEVIPNKNLAPKTILAFCRIENTTYTLSRNVLSWVNNRLNRFFLGLNFKDVNWVKAYKTASIQQLDLEIKSSLVESEICSKLIYLGYKPIELDSKYLPRISGQSKGASFKIVKQAILDILKLIVVFRRFKKQHPKN